MKKSYIILGVVLLVITVIVVIAFKNKKFLAKVPTEIKPPDTAPLNTANNQSSGMATMR